MPPKKKADEKADKRHRVDGKTFVWTAEDGSEVKIPLRLEVAVLRSMNDRDLDVLGMFDLLDMVAPGHGDVFDKMDTATDFRPMFDAWQEEYQALSGASTGE